MALSTTRKFSIGLFAVTAIAVLFAGIAYLSVNEISSSAGWVTHTNQVLLTLENLGADLSAAESGERGYLLTSKPEYLEPYYSVRDAIPRRLAELDRLTADNPPAAREPRYARAGRPRADGASSRRSSTAPSRAGSRPVPPSSVSAGGRR